MKKDCYNCKWEIVPLKKEKKAFKKCAKCEKSGHKMKGWKYKDWFYKKDIS